MTRWQFVESPAVAAFVRAGWRVLYATRDGGPVGRPAGCVMVRGA